MSEYYKMLNFLLILSLCWQTVNSADQCSEFDLLSEDEIWVIIRPIAFQNYFVISFGTLSLACLVATISTWKIYKSFSVPSDIMFAICWAQLIENSCLVGSSFYFLVHSQNTVPPNFPISCTIISIVYTIGNTSSLIYNVVFCLVLSVSIRKTLKGTIFSQARYHTLILLAVTAITLALSLTEVTNAGFSGICGYRLQNRESFARFIGDIVIVSVCLFSMFMFRSKVPKNSYFKNVSVFGFYYYYMGFFSVIQVLSSTGYLISNIACMLNASIATLLIQISTTFGNCSAIVLSFVLTGLRFSHPMLRMKIKKYFRKQNNHYDPEQQMIEDRPWLGSLLQSIKGSQIISLLTGVLISFVEHENKIKRMENITNFSYKKNYIIRLKEGVTDQYMMRKVDARQSLIVKQKLDGMRPLDYEVTAYSIQIFSSLLSMEEQINIFQSFNISSNLSLVKEKSYTDGGKSGQFFFCTFDNKFLIKTVTQDQAQLYIQKIKDFYQYYRKNPHSMIAKILGLYKFVRNDIQEQPVYIILMRNVSPYDRKFQQRVYDIKGSEFNRSTIDEKKIQNPQKLRNHTLKDQDFKKLQRRICIEPEYSVELKKQLKKDAQFLGTMQVMDYSILIIKRKGTMRENNEKNQKYRFNQFPSYAAKDEYYNIGIIDYLQSWTLKRKAERAFKTMITKKKVTVTSPDEYSRRLSEFVDEII